MNTSRRKFLSSMAGASALTINSELARAQTNTTSEKRLPREVWIASFCQHGMQNDNPDDMIKFVLKEIDKISYHQPDIICLPETFPYAHFYKGRPSISELAEIPLGPITGLFSEAAKKYNCYIICPLYTVHKDRYYNSAVVLNRQGKVLGEYWKIHPTEDEMEKGISPGPLDAPVFETDFGKIGIQICFDINWQAGWSCLSDKGAEIIFWPSAFGGGEQIPAKAWQNKCCVVSSTNYGITQICDLTGEIISYTGHWSVNWATGMINLERVFLHTWPYVNRFADIEKKYGRTIRIRNFHEEEWTILESLSPDVKVEHIIKEFDLKTHKEHIASAERIQDKLR